MIPCGMAVSIAVMRGIVGLRPMDEWPPLAARFLERILEFCMLKRREAAS